MSRVFNLFRLQRIDSQIDRCINRIKEIETLLSDDAEVRSAKETLTGAETLHSQASHALSSAEEQTRAQRLKIEQTENHLYSGKVSNPKELQDQQQEVAALKRYLLTLEDRQLEAMLALEEAEETLRAASAGLDGATARALEGSATLRGEQTHLEGELSRLDSERAVVASALTAEDLELYDSLRAKRGGVAVAEAGDRSCSACGASLNAALYQAARSPSRLAYCDTCGRILYSG